MSKGSNHIVTNKFARWWIAFRMLLSVFGIIRKQYPFFKALKVLKQLIRRKKIIQGIYGIPRFYKSQGKIFYELNTPPWPSASFTKFFATEINKSIEGSTKSNQIQNAILSITTKCHLDCKHCFEWDRLGNEEHLSSVELQCITSRLQTAGASIIQIGGGEPLERLTDCCILARIHKESTDFWLLTSGYQLDRFKIEFLRFSGYKGINIGLDHWDPEKHNAFRGNDLSFRWAIDAAQSTVSAGLVLAFTICATKEFISKDNLYKYLELAKDLKASFIQILEPREAGRHKDKNVALSPAQRDLITEFYRSVNNDKQYKTYPTITYHGAFQRSHGCLGAACRYIYIDSHGQVHACPFCQEAAGDIRKTNLDEILNNIRKKGCHLYKDYSDN
jgi:MoaA/NifB/PqqE/SkfB family radical SAM enzyme